MFVGVVCNPNTLEKFEMKMSSYVEMISLRRGFVDEDGPLLCAKDVSVPERAKQSLAAIIPGGFLPGGPGDLLGMAKVSCVPIPGFHDDDSGMHIGVDSFLLRCDDCAQISLFSALLKM